MKVLSGLRWVVVIVALTLLAIEIHELGHLLTYLAFGYPARMSLQRVTPLGDVPTRIDLWAKFAGPAVSLVGAAIFLAVARRHSHGFVWVTASFTNASLRLFPCTMDLLRAFKGGPPFSDEGEVALAFTAGHFGRSAFIALALCLSLVLTILAAREYRFQRYRIVKSILIYLLTLTVGIAVVIADELLGSIK